jgi:NADH:ubiquinone oxidoreductase subunit 5 (subunit L)/multisubunit Na+/H+ antiporter MnhA subunit
MSPEQQQLVLWLIPGAPLLAAVVIAFLGPRFLRSRSHLPCWLALATSAVCALILLFHIMPVAFESAEHEGAAVIAAGYPWLSIGTMNIRIDLRADAMSALMLSMVTTVSFLV